MHLPTRNARYVFDKIIREIETIYSQEEANSIAFHVLESAYGLDKSSIITKQPFPQSNYSDQKLEEIIQRLQKPRTGYSISCVKLGSSHENSR